MTIDKSALKALAEKATQGEWWIDSHGHTMMAMDSLEIVFTTGMPTEDAVRHPETGNLSSWRNDWDASFIAAANPATILALLAEIDDIKSRLVATEERNIWLGEYNTQRHAELSVENVRVISDRLKAEKERDQLKAENESLRKDAERYRWLRSGGYLHRWVSLHPCDESKSSELTDKAIDDAMSIKSGIIKK